MTEPAATAYDGAGSVYALAMRLTKLAADGTFATGPGAMIVTDALVRIEFSLNYRDGEAIERVNGAGRVCLSHQAPPQVTGLAINALEICSEDPVLEQFLSGGTVFVDADGTPIGYQAPEVGSDPMPYGVAVEAFSAAIMDGAYAATLPYMHWAFPRLFLRQQGKTLQNDAMAPVFEGTGNQNPNFGDGPANDFDQDSSAVYQWVRVADVPDPTDGAIAVPAAV